MTLISKLKDYIIQEQIISVKDKDKISISLMISDAPRRADVLSRRYIISIDHKRILSVKFLPKSWRFLPQDIMKTRSLYSGFHSFKVPKLLGYFLSTEGYFFIEEYIHPAISMAMLIEKGDINSQQAKEIIRDILAEIGKNADPADREFIIEEKTNYYNYLKILIGECYLYNIVIEYLEKLIDDNSMSLKRVWSPGDIIDRNILLSDGHWYLVDFEYCHQTLFLFKEAYRSIHYSKWARNLRIHDFSPWLGKFPNEAAELLSLAWENYLYSEVLDRQAIQRFQTKSRRLSWNILCPQLTENIMQLETSLKEKEYELNMLQKELNNIKAGIGWRLIKKYGQIKDQIIPANTIRRDIFAMIFNKVKVCIDK